MQAKDTESLGRQLSDVDIARLLLPFTDSFGQSSNLHFVETAQQWFSEWQETYGVELLDLSLRIRSIRSQRGYQQRAARFSRTNDYRRSALDNLFRALVANSRRELDRWGWALFAYIEAVKSFAIEEDQRQANIRLRAEATTSLDLPSSAYPVLRALLKLKETETRESNALEEPSAIRAGALMRLLEYQEQLRKRIKEEHELVRRRDELFASLPPELINSPEVDAVGKLRSLQNQIDRYQQLIGDSIRVKAQLRLLTILGGFDSEMLRVTSSHN